MSTHESLPVTKSGVYRTPAVSDGIRRSLPLNGRWIEIDLGASRDKAHVLAAFAAAFELGDTFGRNWDALADALQDGEALRAEAYVVHLKDAGSAAPILGADWTTLLDVLSDAAGWWKRRGKPFIVLVDDAAGPAQWS